MDVLRWVGEALIRAFADAAGEALFEWLRSFVAPLVG